MPYLKISMSIPEEWLSLIKKYMKIQGYQDYAELVRDLLREKIPEMRRVIEQYESSAKSDEELAAVGVVA